MKKNLKLNLSWLALIVVLFGILELLAKTNILNLYYIQILMGIGISILMGLGTNLVLGFSGQFTLGQAGFMAIGAYATAIITQQNPTYGCFYFSMLVGIVIAVLVALVFGNLLGPAHLDAVENVGHFGLIFAVQYIPRFRNHNDLGVLVGHAPASHVVIGFRHLFGQRSKFSIGARDTGRQVRLALDGFIGL